MSVEDKAMLTTPQSLCEVCDMMLQRAGCIYSETADKKKWRMNRTDDEHMSIDDE